jgi:hypothetical protein
VDIDFDRPPLPDPGDKGARFVGWLNKKKRRQPIQNARQKASDLNLDLDEFIRKMGPEYLRIARDPTKGGQGKEKVYLMNEKSTWAALWEIWYDCRRGHHGQTISLPKDNDF